MHAREGQAAPFFTQKDKDHAKKRSYLASTMPHGVGATSASDAVFCMMQIKKKMKKKRYGHRSAAEQMACEVRTGSVQTKSASTM